MWNRSPEAIGIRAALVDEAERTDALGRHRLLEEEQVVIGERMRHAQRVGRAESAMRVDGDVDLVAHRTPDRLDLSDAAAIAAFDSHSVSF